jgi:hypothetical protein
MARQAAEAEALVEAEAERKALEPPVDLIVTRSVKKAGGLSFLSCTRRFVSVELSALQHRRKRRWLHLII